MSKGVGVVMVVAILIGTLSFPLVNSVLVTTSATGLEKTSKVVNFNNVAGGLSVTQNRVFKQFASALPSGSWTIDFDYKYTASNIPTFGIFVLSATSDDPQIQSAPNQLEIIHGNFIGDNALSVEGPLSTTSAEIPISPNVQYYVELDKMPTLLTLNVFSDPARTIQVTGSPATLAISSTDYNNNLNFLQHDGCTYCGDSRTLTAQIDNTEISVKDSNGNQHHFFIDNYSTSHGWTQIGSSITVDGH